MAYGTKRYLVDSKKLTTAARVAARVPPRSFSHKLRVIDGGSAIERTRAESGTQPVPALAVGGLSRAPFRLARGPGFRGEPGCFEICTHFFPGVFSHLGAGRAHRPTGHADALHPEFLLGDRKAPRAAVAGYPLRQRRAQRIEAAGKLDRLVHIAVDRRAVVVVDRGVAGNLIEVGAVV